MKVAWWYRRLGIKRSRGLTLLEVLVALAILTLLMAVLMAGWLQATQAQSRLTDAAQRMQQRQQISHLLRRFVAEALEPVPGSGTVFTGDAATLTAESTSAPEPTAGAAPLATRLGFTGTPRRLEVLAQGQTSAEYPWRFERAAIAYVDEAGQGHDQWPPLQGLPIEGTQPARPLPSLVQFTLLLAGDPQALIVLAAPRAAGWWLPEPSPPIAGLEE